MIEGYKLRYKLWGYPNQTYRFSAITPFSKAITHQLLNLLTFQAYEISIAAFNKAGDGSYCERIKVLTLPGRPLAPPDLREPLVVASDKVVLSWVDPPIPTINGVIVAYQIIMVEVYEGVSGGEERQRNINLTEIQSDLEDDNNTSDSVNSDNNMNNNINDNNKIDKNAFTSSASYSAFLSNNTNSSVTKIYTINTNPDTKEYPNIQNKYKIGELKKYHKYGVAISCMTVVGSSPMSPFKTFTTLQDGIYLFIYLLISLF